jgi:hypothetical protein
MMREQTLALSSTEIACSTSMRYSSSTESTESVYGDSTWSYAAPTHIDKNETGNCPCGRSCPEGSGCQCVYVLSVVRGKEDI